ncbi:UDP-N-acetylmuramoyl-L-alanine--D-glutamate ligase [Candidatus Saccharibacteria bacterium]|nr:UDP-N-acetylmuramoyl-L-alanine--D-glutamate ligase [Candidatus Saccharibacteria bacterium]
MKIGIVGWGLEGQSAFRFYGAEHEYLIVNEEPRNDFPVQDKRLKIQFLPNKRAPGLTGNVADLSYLDGIEGCDKIIYSVTNAKNLEKKFGKNPDFWSKATTIQHLFFEQVKTKNIIGVTGTKGKGTTSTLIHEMLKAAGKRAFLGGNIGTPVLDFVRDVMPDDWVVLELSNFQLYNLTYSPHIAVCLMVTPEHMDWHPDMQDYAEAKANIFRHQRPDDIAIYLADNQYSKKLAGYSAGQKIPYYRPPGAYLNEYDKVAVGDTEIIDKSEIKLLGEHNLQNVCAALTAVWQVTQDVSAARKVLSTFSGLEHRLEFVRELDGVKYYDDSFGTTPETAIVAMKSFETSKIMILGGSDKGADFDELAEVIKGSNVKHAIVVGQIADKIVNSLKQAGYKNTITGLSTMPQIVQKAQEIAQPGDVVLLSAAAASFGLFKDYKDRGNQFKKAVAELA